MPAELGMLQRPLCLSSIPPMPLAGASLGISPLGKWPSPSLLHASLPVTRSCPETLSGFSGSSSPLSGGKKGQVCIWSLSLLTSGEGSGTLLMVPASQFPRLQNEIKSSPPNLGLRVS